MKIKVEVKTIFKIPTSPLKATATVIFDDCFIVRNVKLIENERGMGFEYNTERIKARSGGKWAVLDYRLVTSKILYKGIP